jgi:hypothetical protein
MAPGFLLPMVSAPCLAVPAVPRRISRNRNACAVSSFAMHAKLMPAHRNGIPNPCQQIHSSSLEKKDLRPLHHSFFKIVVIRIILFFERSSH